MIQIKCDVNEKMPLGMFEPFQGDLKKRTDKDIKQLIDSIKSEGLLAPFYIWKHDGHNYLLDGHGRLTALTDMLLEDTSIADQEFPYISIEADTEDDARAALLNIVSTYGKVTKTGVMKFVAPMQKVVAAPVVQKYNKGSAVKKEKEADNKIIRISVPASKYADVIGILGSVDYIKVL